MGESSRRLRLIRKILIIVAGAAVVASAFVVMWQKGMFLPSWIEWNEKSLATDNDIPLNISLSCEKVTAFSGREWVWESEDNLKVQDILSADIDWDGQDELLLLCWKIGRYGRRRPFWIERDENKWSQHIFVYDLDKGSVNSKWKASNIGADVASWEIINDHFLHDTDPNGQDSFWMWISWGFEKIDESDMAAYVAAIEAKRENESEAANESLTIPVNDDAVIDNNELEIVMVGDVLLHDGVTKACKTKNGEYDFHVLFEHVNDDIRNADIAIVNQEVILGGSELRVTGYPSFNAPYEVGDALCDAGFDIVCHGTNHALDRSKTGIENCLDYWRNSHPETVVLGICDDEDAKDDVYIYEENGYRIAVLNYTYGTNGIPLPADMPYAVNLMREEKVKNDLEYAEREADFTVVCPHWGIEYKLQPSAEQEKWAEYFTENGADLIIGTHPHVIEPIEWIESENGNRALCYYSLGNFINWTSGKGPGVANRMLGAMADVVLLKDKSGNVVIDDYSVKSLISHIEPGYGLVSTYYLNDYPDELAERNEIISADSSFSKRYCVEISEEVFGDLWE